MASSRLTGGTVGVQWLSGRVFDLESKGGNFVIHRRHCGNAVAQW